MAAVGDVCGELGAPSPGGDDESRECPLGLPRQRGETSGRAQRGALRVEVQTWDRQPVEGFGLEDCEEIWGDEIERDVRWRGGGIGVLESQPVRLRLAAPRRWTSTPCGSGVPRRVDPGRAPWRTQGLSPNGMR